MDDIDMNAYTLDTSALTLEKHPLSRALATVGDLADPKPDDSDTFKKHKATIAYGRKRLARVMDGVPERIAAYHAASAKVEEVAKRLRAAELAVALVRAEHKFTCDERSLAAKKACEGWGRYDHDTQSVKTAIECLRNPRKRAKVEKV